VNRPRDLHLALQEWFWEHEWRPARLGEPASVIHERIAKPQHRNESVVIEISFDTQLCKFSIVSGVGSALKENAAS